MDQAQVLIGLLRKVGGVLRIHQRLLARIGAVSLPLLLSLLGCLQGLCNGQSSELQQEPHKLCTTCWQYLRTCWP